jgi:DNA-binding winged helix-turn-helix (wHTH) protein
VNRPRSVRNIWLLYALVGILFLSVSVIGVWQVVEVRQQLIEASLNRAYLSATAYVQATERWLMDGDMETLLRVSHLMISGGTRSIEITETDLVLLELRSSDMPAEFDLQHTDAQLAGPTRVLLKTTLGWMIETTIPLERASIGSREIRLWMDAEPLHMRVTASTSKIAASVILCWLVLAGGLVLGLRRNRAFVMTQPGLAHSDNYPWTVDPEIKRVSIHDRPISLTPKQYALLSLLVSGRRRVFSEKEILESIWPQSPYADSNDIRQCVYKIRKRVAMVAPGAEACIVNEMGFGYRFEPSELPDASPSIVASRSKPAVSESFERRKQ